jgi:hypothetical protein
VSDTLAAVLTKEPEGERVPVKVGRLLKPRLEKAAKRARRQRRRAAAVAVGLLGVSSIARRATRSVDRPLMRFSADLGRAAWSAIALLCRSGSVRSKNCGRWAALRDRPQIAQRLPIGTDGRGPIQRELPREHCSVLGCGGRLGEGAMSVGRV